MVTRPAETDRFGLKMGGPWVLLVNQVILEAIFHRNYSGT